MSGADVRLRCRPPVLVTHLCVCHTASEFFLPHVQRTGTEGYVAIYAIARRRSATSLNVKKDQYKKTAEPMGLKMLFRYSWRGRKEPKQL